MDNLHITQDPRYLHHNGKPVLMIWGFFADRLSTNLAHQIIDFFKTNATYGVTLVGGGEWWWRTETTPGWSNVFRRFDVYSPWNVGNYSIGRPEQQIRLHRLLVAGLGGSRERRNALPAGDLSGIQLG